MNSDDLHAAIRNQLSIVLEDLQSVALLSQDSLLVIGASSSEIVGERIGTHTSMEVGRTVVETVMQFTQHAHCHVAFQCCEHLNRSLVVSRAYAKQAHLTEVSAIPVPGAGGAVAAAAYLTLLDPILVSNVSADAGVDIGDTLIGMHLKAVAVPVRGRLREIVRAHVTMARTRPPLIGGARAVYDPDEAARRTMSVDHS